MLNCRNRVIAGLFGDTSHINEYGCATNSGVHVLKFMSIIDNRFRVILTK
jgi:hypothetical protein